MLLEGVKEAAARETPHLDLVVIGGRHQTLAVAREANAAHRRHVRSEHLRLPFAGKRDACMHTQFTSGPSHKPTRIE